MVVAGLAQHLGRAVAADRAGRLVAAEDLAGGDDDAYPGVRLRLQHALRAHRGKVLLHRDGVEGVAVTVLADQSLELVGELPPRLQPRDQAALQRELGRIALQGVERRRRLGM